VAGCDAVIHLAAKVSLGVDLTDIDYSSGPTRMAVMMCAAAEASVRRVVFTSSMVVYG
jgi:dTDP-L-rhamnose 4-epimerase